MSNLATSPGPSWGSLGSTYLPSATAVPSSAPGGVPPNILDLGSVAETSCVTVPLWGPGSAYFFCPCPPHMLTGLSISDETAFLDPARPPPPPTEHVGLSPCTRMVRGRVLRSGESIATGGSGLQQTKEAVAVGVVRKIKAITFFIPLYTLNAQKARVTFRKMYNKCGARLGHSKEKLPDVRRELLDPALTRAGRVATDS